MALPGELSDAEVFGASQPGPVGRTFAPPGELTDAEVFGAPPPPAPPPAPAAPPPAPALPEGTLGVKSIADALVPSADTAGRFWLNAKDAFQNTIVGETLNRVRSGQTAQTATDAANRALREAEAAGSPVALDRFADGTPSPYAQMPLDLVRTEAARGQQMADERRPVYEADRAARVAEFEALRPWHQADGITNKATSGGAALFGQLAGSLPSPENLIGGPGTRVARGAGEAVLPFVVRNMGAGAGEAAAANVVANPVVQSGQVQRGEKPEFSTEELGESVLLGVGAGGTLRLAGMGWRALRDALGRQRGVDPNTITPDQVTPDDARAVAQIDPEFKAFAEANGIDLTATTPDPRVAVLEDRLAKRRALEANRPEPGVTPPPESVAAIFAENQRRAGEGANLAPDDAVPTVRPLPVVDPDAMGPASGGVARAFTSPVAPEGTIHPSASGLKARDRISDPILIDRQGGAFVADDGNVAGRGHAGVVEAGERKSVADVFRLAERQRERVGPEIRDTQTAGRPLGLDDSPIVRVDGEQPVRVVDADPKGRPIVEPYDPRTGEVTGDRYVATGKLRDVRYSADPRMAQDFVERAQGPKPPELPRWPRDAVIRQPQQTYRAGEVERPQAAPGRQPPPEPPAGPLAAPAPKAIAGAAPEAKNPLALPAPEPRPALPAPAARESYEAMLERFRKEEGVAIGGMQRYRTSRQRAEETARMRAYREDGGAAEVDAFVRDNGGIEFDHSEVFQHYRRADGETPKQAAERAVERWVELEERRAIQDYDARSSESLDDPIDFSTPLERTDPATEAAARLDRETFDESFAERNHGGRQEDGSGTAGAAGEAGGPGGRPGEKPGTRQEAPPDGGSDALRRPDRDASGEAGRDAGGQRNDGEVGSGASGRQDGPEQGLIPGTERTDRRPADQAAGRVKPPQEPPPKGGLFDDDARNQIDLEDAIKAKKEGGTTLSSTPFLDPRLWSGLAKMAGFNAAYTRDLKASAVRFADAFGGSEHKTWLPADWGRMAFHSIDGEMRSIGAVYDSPAIQRLADMWHAPADVGRGNTVGRTYFEAERKQADGWINRVRDALRSYVDKPAALDQIVAQIQSGRIAANTPIGKAAGALRDMLAEMHQYAKAAGVDVGHVQNYFPHVMEAQKVIGNPAGFVRDATAQYMRHNPGMTRADALAKAEALHEGIALGDIGVKLDGTDFVRVGGKPNGSFTEPRVLLKKMDAADKAFFEKWYYTDPVDVLQTHIQRVVRRAEWARRMGDDLAEWKKIKQDILDEGGAPALERLVSLVSTTAGLTGRSGRAATAAADSIRLAGLITTLPRAAVSAIVELGMPVIRSGRPHRLLLDIGNFVKSATGHMKEQAGIAEDLGLIRTGLQDSLLGQRYFAFDRMSKVAQDVANRFFRRTGLEWITTHQRVMATRTGQVFLRRMALNLDSGTAVKSSRLYLKELGVPEAEIDGFGKWVAAQSKGTPSRATLKADTGMERIYNTALIRFVNQTIMAPNKSTRPQWHSTQLGSIAAMLQSYAYAFQKNVLNRAGAGLLQATKSGISMRDRMEFVAPAMLLPLLVAMRAGVDPVRQAIWGDPEAKEPTDGERAKRALSGAGMFGIADPLINAVDAVRYQKSVVEAVAGPELGKLATTLTDAAKFFLSNSDKTNAAERKLTKDVYSVVVAPALTTMLLFAPPGVGAIGIQAVTSGKAREEFTSAVAGPKEQRGGRGPARPARPQRAQR